MSCLILHFFYLILGVFFNLAPDVVYKDSRFSKVFTQKGIKLVKSWWSCIVAFDTAFALLPAEKKICSFKKEVVKDTRL